MTATALGETIVHLIPIQAYLANLVRENANDLGTCTYLALTLYSVTIA